MAMDIEDVPTQTQTKTRTEWTSDMFVISTSPSNVLGPLSSGHLKFEVSSTTSVFYSRQSKYMGWLAADAWQKHQN